MHLFALVMQCRLKFCLVDMRSDPSDDCYMMRPQRTATRSPKIAVNSETNYFLFTKSNIVSVFRLDQ